MHWKHAGPYVSPVIQQMPNVKSSSLCDLNFDRTIWREIASALPMTISELQLSGGVLNNEILLELTPYITSNPALKVLNLLSNYRVSTEGWGALFNLMSGLRVEELHIHETTIIGSTLTILSDCVASIQTLKVLKSPAWVPPSEHGLEMLRTFTSTLVAHPFVEYGHIERFDFPDAETIDTQIIQ